ncbi:DUF1801 domain-containing protein [Saccharomonospora sp. NPDC046836]|uniref:iron chaperone n=1 Tax=Saccharomonospora sp. NPDC046836 TaxID=3156921 RepID=UPI0033CF536C
MQSSSSDVTAYLDEVAPARRAALAELRRLCRELLPGFEESMSYGMPTYLRDGVAEVGWASQKQYISLYILRTDVLNSHSRQLFGLNLGKGCIRYRRPDQIDFPVVRSLLTATAEGRGPVC